MKPLFMDLNFLLNNDIRNKQEHVNYKILIKYYFIKVSIAVLSNGLLS